MSRIRRLAQGLSDRFLGLVHELGKFGVVGLATYAVDVGLFNLFRYGLDLHWLAAKSASVAIAASLAFVGNRFWTWRHRRNSGLTREYLLYFTFNVVGLGIALGCLAVNDALGQVWPGVFHTPLAENVAGNVVGLVLGTMFRFYTYRRWVFLPVAPSVETVQIATAEAAAPRS